MIIIEEKKKKEKEKEIIKHSRPPKKNCSPSVINGLKVPG
jgi:hypothetical protein